MSVIMSIFLTLFSGKYSSGSKRLRYYIGQGKKVSKELPRWFCSIVVGNKHIPIS